MPTGRFKIYMTEWANRNPTITKLSKTQTDNIFYVKIYNDALAMIYNFYPVRSRR